MLDRIVAAGLQNIVKSDDVRLDVGVRVGDRVADTRLGGKVYDDFGLVLRENVIDEQLVRNIPPDECVLDRAGCRDFFNLSKTILLQRDIVIVVHVVEADNMPSRQVAQKAHYEVRADEAGGTGDHNISTKQILHY